VSRVKVVKKCSINFTTIPSQTTTHQQLTLQEKGEIAKWSNLFTGLEFVVCKLNCQKIYRPHPLLSLSLAFRVGLVLGDEKVSPFVSPLVGSLAPLPMHLYIFSYFIASNG